MSTGAAFDTLPTDGALTDDQWRAEEAHHFTKIGDPADRLIPGDEFILDSPAELPLVWGDPDTALWAEGQSLEVVAPIGAGKTTLAGQLFFARIGLRDKVLGFPVAETPRRVLYLACDRPPQIASALRRLTTEADRSVLHSRARVWRGPPFGDLARHPHLLTELAVAADASDVFIDSFKDVALGLSDDEVGAGLNRAIQEALVNDVQVVGLHHQRKAQSGQKPKALEDVYGSTWITAGAGSVVLLWGEAGDPVVDFVHLKPLRDPAGPWKIEHDHDAGTSSILRGPPDPYTMLRHATTGLTAEAVARVLFDTTTPDDKQKARARARLERLVNKGRAHREDPERGGAGGTTPATYSAIHGASDAASDAGGQA